MKPLSAGRRGPRTEGRRRTEEENVIAAVVLAVVLIGGLVTFAWAERRSATGHPIQPPAFMRVDADLPLHGRGAVAGEVAIVGVSALIILGDLAVLELLIR